MQNKIDPGEDKDLFLQTNHIWLHPLPFLNYRVLSPVSYIYSLSIFSHTCPIPMLVSITKFCCENLGDIKLTCLLLILNSCVYLSYNRSNNTIICQDRNPKKTGKCIAKAENQMTIIQKQSSTWWQLVSGKVVALKEKGNIIKY